MDLWAVQFLDNGALGKRVLEFKNYLHATDILDLVLRKPSFFPPFFISHLIAVLTAERALSFVMRFKLVVLFFVFLREVH